MQDGADRDDRVTDEWAVFLTERGYEALPLSSPGMVWCVTPAWGTEDSRAHAERLARAFNEVQEHAAGSDPDQMLLF